VTGSIYEGFSPRGQRALADLRVAFQQAGFYAEKERRTERSLRVYPERRWRYPLLNPELVRSRSDARLVVRQPSVVCPLYSDGDELIKRLLADFPRIEGCSYSAAPPRRAGRYFLHGYVTIPLRFIGESKTQRIAFDAMAPVLQALQLELSRAAL